MKIALNVIHVQVCNNLLRTPMITGNNVRGCLKSTMNDETSMGKHADNTTDEPHLLFWITLTAIKTLTFQ